MKIRKAFQTARDFILRDLWSRQIEGLSGLRRFIYRFMRTLSLAVHGFVTDRCPLRAASLTLVFMFSLFPALAVGFSVAKGLGAQPKVEKLIYAQLRLFNEAGEVNPHTAQIKELLDAGMEHVERTSVEALGFIGFIILLYAAYKVLSAIEKTMNAIWGIRGRRHVLRRAVDYIAVLFVFPLMLILAALVTAALQSGAVLKILGLSGLPWLTSLLGMLVAFLFSVFGFWFLYFYFPNTRVPVMSALTGAIVATVSLQLIQYGFVKLQFGVARASAVYGTFAAFPIFVLWLQALWTSVLFGAELSYAHANEMDLQFGGLSFRPSAAYKEHLALGAMTVAGGSFQNERPPCTCGDIAARLAAPTRVTREVIDDLVAAGLLATLKGEPPAYQPAVPLDQITLGRVVQAVRERGDESIGTAKALEDLGIARMFAAQKEATEGFDDITLLDALRADATRGVAENPAPESAS